MDDQSKKLQWFPHSYSKNKKDIIFKNQILNCQSEYGCGTIPGCQHNPSYHRFEFKNYFKKKIYTYLTLGCSVTSGVEIKKKDTWPNYLTDAIDFSVPGIGIDAIWHNLNFLTNQKDVRFQKIIMLLPPLWRKTFRIKKNNLLFSFITTPTSGIDTRHNFAFRTKELEFYNNKHQRFVTLKGEQYGTRIMTRFVKWLKNQSFDFFISSWESKTYHLLEKNFSGKELLPQFDAFYRNDPNIEHPSKYAHQKWFEQIRHYIQ